MLPPAAPAQSLAREPEGGEGAPLCCDAASSSVRSSPIPAAADADARLVEPPPLPADPPLSLDSRRLALVEGPGLPLAPPWVLLLLLLALFPRVEEVETGVAGALGGGSSSSPPPVSADACQKRQKKREHRIRSHPIPSDPT